MRPTTTLPILSLILLLLAAVSTAQTVQVEVSSSELSVGDSLFYTVRTTGYVQVSGTPTTTSDALFRENFESRQQRFINREQETSYTWRFTAVGVGPFTIHPPRISINGQVRPVENVTGHVNAARRIDTSRLGRVGFVDADPADRARIGDRFFATTEASTTTPHVGEVFWVTTYAHWRAGYENPNVALPRVNKLPAASAFVYPGLRGSRFYNAPLSGNSVVIIDGVRYFRQATHSVPVVAMRGGRHEVESLAIDLRLGMGNNRSIPLDLPALPVDVQPLPPRIDQSVARFVGVPTLSMMPDREQARQGELISVTLRVSGEGYWEPVDLDALPEIPGLRLVDREVAFRIDNMNRPFVSTKEFHLVYQATDAGTILFPALGFSVFNPATAEQEYVELAGFELFVERSEGSTFALRPDGGAADMPIRRGTARTLDADGLLYIHTGALSSRTYDPDARPIGLRPAYWAAHAVPLLLLGAGGLLVARRRRLLDDPDEQRRLRLREAVASGLDRCLASLAASDVGDFHASLASALEAAVALRVGQSPGAFTREELAALLRSAQVTPADAAATVRLLEKCDSMRYAPVSTEASMAEHLGEGERLIEVLAPARPRKGA